MKKEIIDEAIKKSYENTGSFQIDYIIYLVYGEIFPARKMYSEIPEEIKAKISNIVKFTRNKQYIKDLLPIASAKNIAKNCNCVSYLIDTNPVIFMDNFVLCFEGDYNDDLVIHYRGEGYDYSYLYNYTVQEISNDDVKIKYFDGKNFSRYKIKSIDNSDILDHYNEDLPNEEILDFINDSSTGGLCLLHGIPGSGKSYYIRSLIKEFPDKEFVYCEGKNLDNLLSINMIDLVQDSIIILEDCEDLIKDRNNNYFAGQVSQLLNAADGIIGDCINAKIICTFNTRLNNIDKALVRKGRIKVKYEFGELTQDRADALRKRLNKVDGTSNVLCDILNSDSAGVQETSKPNKIGFV